MTESLRPLLFSISYRMLGSVSDAEDILQEAFLRFEQAQREGVKIESAKAYLATITTRLSIDHLRKARVKREQYGGMWLSEPLLVDPAPDVSEQAETSESLSLAVLVILETLSPVERAVFLLREAFDYGYAEIAEVVHKSEDNCRQILVRARRRIAAREPRFETSQVERDELAERFFAAFDAGGAPAVARLLAGDALGEVARQGQLAGERCPAWNH